VLDVQLQQHKRHTHRERLGSELSFAWLSGSLPSTDGTYYIAAVGHGLFVHRGNFSEHQVRVSTDRPERSTPSVNGIS